MRHFSIALALGLLLGLSPVRCQQDDDNADVDDDDSLQIADQVVSESVPIEEQAVGPAQPVALPQARALPQAAQVQPQPQPQAQPQPQVLPQAPVVMAAYVKAPIAAPHPDHKIKGFGKKVHKEKKVEEVPEGVVTLKASVKRYQKVEEASKEKEDPQIKVVHVEDQKKPEVKVVYVRAPITQVEADSKNAHEAAQTAKQAAKVATKVAEHSVQITEHAKSALKDAHNALHEARVDSAGLSRTQKKSLKNAEAALKAATQKAEVGELKRAKYVKAEVDDEKLKMQDRMSKMKKVNELEQMRAEVRELRKQLEAKGGDEDTDEILSELESEIAELEKGKGENARSHDELKAEIERLRQEIADLPDPTTTAPPPVEVTDVDVKQMPEEQPAPAPREEPSDQTVQSVQSKGIDIDTAMPYGDLEPFGREDTAQELTEASVHESDAMVDQLERAEVAEEKRAVFRALTRLRGAAITSFDGVARSQTGNIDQYNKINKWRNSHPLHHLADEESDVGKWAFPDNAD